MPFDFIRQVWDTPCQSHTQKLVLAALAGYADKDGKCWPSIEALSRRCNLSERATYAQVELLKKAGLISVKSGGGRHHVNTYRICLGNPAPETLNDKQCLANTECGAINPARRSINPARRAPQLPLTAKELPGGRNPLPYLKSLEKLIERAEKESERIFRAHCLENSLGGNRWNPPSAESEYNKWRHQRAEAKAKIKNGEYIV